MRPAVIRLEVGLPHLLIWIGFVGLLVVGYLLFWRWRRRQPKTKSRETSYSERLERRLAQGGKGGKARSSPRPRVAGDHPPVRR